MAKEWDQGVDGRLHSAGLKCRQIQKILSQNGFKKALGPFTSLNIIQVPFCSFLSVLPCIQTCDESL